MYLMSNQNGDWVEISEGSKLFILNTDGVDFQEYLQNEGLTVESWLWGDKLENEIMQYGQTITIEQSDLDGIQ